jgi:hypothetical protein
MFLAWRELRFAPVAAVIALIAVLMVMLSGLSVGLVRDGVSGLQNLPVTSFAFAHGVQTDSAFSRSVVDTSAVDAWQKQPGVADAAPFGNMLVNTRTDKGAEIDLALFGVQPDSFLSPGGRCRGAARCGGWDRGESDRTGCGSAHRRCGHGDEAGHQDAGGGGYPAAGHVRACGRRLRSAAVVAGDQVRHGPRCAVARACRAGDHRCRGARRLR